MSKIIDFKSHIKNKPLQTLVERNSWEGETYRYYFDVELFAKEIELLPQVVKLNKSYELGKLITGKDFDKLPDGSGYIAHHNLVYSFERPFTRVDQESDDPFYKGRGLRIGGWEELQAAKWWKANKEGTIPLLWQDSKPGWSRQVKCERGMHQQVVLGHKCLSFIDGNHYKGVEVGMEFLDWKRKKIVVVDSVNELTGKEQLEHFEDYPFYNTYDGRKEPCEHVTTFTYKIKDLK